MIFLSFELERRVFEGEVGRLDPGLNTLLSNPFRPFWQGQGDSNSRHLVLETNALPTELYPY